MKRNKVKGFTLAELIVVMAIFSLVLAAAWSLMGPVGKMMSLADVRESGSANINAIAKYLQVELSSTEYIMPINYIPADEGKAAVNRFVERYYEGVLKSGASTTPGAGDYGSGKVHVMMIDNVNHGKISEYVYDVSFQVKSSTFTDCITNQEVIEYAVNKACYEDSDYVIYLGNLNDPTANINHLSGFLTSLNSSQTTFTIKSTVGRGQNRYEFSTTASTPLLNIAQHRAEAAGSGSTGTVKNKYFVVSEAYTPKPDPNDPPEYSAQIVDLYSPNVSCKAAAVQAGDTNSYTYSRSKYGSTSSIEPVFCDADFLDATKPVNTDTSCYCFVYSFGNEMKTS